MLYFVVSFDQVFLHLFPSIPSSTSSSFHLLGRAHLRGTDCNGQLLRNEWVFQKVGVVLHPERLVKGLRGAQLMVNPLRPNSDLSQTSHCNIKGLLVWEVMRIENMITQVKCY